MKEVDLKREKAVQEILEAVGENPQREGPKDAPGSIGFGVRRLTAFVTNR